MNERLANSFQEPLENSHQSHVEAEAEMDSLIRETGELHREWDSIVNSPNFPKWDAPDSELPKTDEAWQALEAKQDRLHIIGNRLDQLEHTIIQIIDQGPTRAS